MDTIRALSPRAAAGVERVHEAIDGDSALPARDKALFTAAAGAVLGQRGLLLSSLERARGLGLGGDAARGAALVLLLNRGEVVFHEFAAAVAEVFGAAPPAGRAAEDDPETSRDEALAYFREHFGGEVPPRQRLFSELAPRAFEGYCLLHRTALKENALGPKTCELLLCAVIAAVYQFGLLEIHVASARKLGATDAELAEAVLCAFPAAGMTVWAGGAAAIAAGR